MRLTGVMLLALLTVLALQACGKKSPDSYLSPYADQLPARIQITPLPVGAHKMPKVQTSKYDPVKNNEEKSYRDIEEVIAQADEHNKGANATGRLRGGQGKPQRDPALEADPKTETTPMQDPSSVEEQDNFTPPIEQSMDVSFRIRTDGDKCATGDANPESSSQEDVNTEPDPPMDMADYLTAIIKTVEKELDLQPNDQRLRDRLLTLYLLAQQEDKAFKLLQHGGIKTLNVNTNLISALVMFREGETEQGLAILESFLSRLRRELPLKISKALLADPHDLAMHPQYFGNYVDRTGAALRPGGFIGIYTEVENFICLKDENNKYNVSIMIWAELLNANGDKLDWKPYEDQDGEFKLALNSKIRDLCPITVIMLPADLPDGAYTLRVLIRDNLDA
ncbi:hypothetical protein ACFL54_09905, partial [Planctomycetota bacterium]